MRLAIIGKFPPIEGGVSAQTYWTALDLAQRGHEVHVVTNASEVESGFREFVFGPDSSKLLGRHLTTRLHVHATSPLRDHAFVPWANPYASKLLGVALSVIEQYDCDLIFGWYFEPYGVVAAQAGKIFSKPVVVRHAGSDIGRLAKHVDLRKTYKWMLGQVQAVLSTGRSTSVREALISVGVSEKRLRVLPITALPSQFSEQGEPIDLDDLLPRLSQWYDESAMSAELRERLLGLNGKPFSHHLPTVGVYGKIGDVKGSYCLLEALALLAKKGLEFNFLSVAGARPHELLRYCDWITERTELAQRTWVLPMLAPWRIPSFLRRCNVVCFLEHDFPIAYHTPLVPREVLASGAALVVSREIADKQPFSESLVDDKNVILIPDPRHSTVLADRIETLLLNEQKRYVIGKHGQYLSKTCEKFFSQTNTTADAVEACWKDA
jgi:glycosyltransferase involved in cell wall biosynthesis